MELNDLSNEIQKLRVRNHDFANILTSQGAQLSEARKLMEELKEERHKINDALSGGLTGQGIINKVENLEAFAKNTKSWLRTIGATLLTLIGKFGYNEFFAHRPVAENSPEVVMVKPDNEIKPIIIKENGR